MRDIVTTLPLPFIIFMSFMVINTSYTLYTASAPTQTDSPLILLPEILGEKLEVECIILALRIPEGLAYFAGHFDEVSVVPGVTQIQWAVHFAKQYLGLSRIFSHMEVVKFKELLLPGQRLNLGLCYQESGCKLSFSYRSETTEFSSGRIYFHDDPI